MNLLWEFITSHLLVVVSFLESIYLRASAWKFLHVCARFQKSLNMIQIIFRITQPLKTEILFSLVFCENWIFKIFHFNFGKKKKFKRTFFEIIFSLTPNLPFTVFSYTKKENYKKVWHSWDQPIQNGKCLKHGRGWFNPCPAF